MRVRYEVGADVVHRELQREKVWSRIHLVPLLLAEGDRDAYRRQLAALEREKEIMKDVPGWEVSGSVDEVTRWKVGRLIVIALDAAATPCSRRVSDRRAKASTTTRSTGLGSGLWSYDGSSLSVLASAAIVSGDDASIQQYMISCPACVSARERAR